ncbi:hypothetical protein V8G54_024296 [Vigna mungo]|uniref:Uncharacterized protein n=1 Tax=Vigna mungo TaxID=3915 RepID=A0AAQ3N6U3_VIGMU
MKHIEESEYVMANGPGGSRCAYRKSISGRIKTVNPHLKDYMRASIQVSRITYGQGLIYSYSVKEKGKESDSNPSFLLFLAIQQFLVFSPFSLYATLVAFFHT